MRKELEEKLLNCNSIFEFITMYFGLSYQEKISIFTEELTIPNGTEFYRIRKKHGFNNTNRNDPKEWAPVPSNIARQGRFNSNKQSILYVASSQDFLEREVGLNVNEEYYLGKYVCRKSFKVGTTLCKNSFVNSIIHKLAMSVQNKDSFTDLENNLVEDYYKKQVSIRPNDMWKDMLSPFYNYKLLSNIYDMTNKIGKLLISKYENGFRYASVFQSPMELSGGPSIITFDGKEYGNYAITEKGYSNIEFISAEEKKCSKILDLSLMIKTFSEE